MAFLDGNAVYKLLESRSDAQQLADAYALRCLVQSATYPANYSTDLRWTKAITPSEAGNELLSELSTQPIPQPDLHLALFGFFWFEDPLIEAISTDLELIRTIVEEEAISGQIYWPMTQGRELYDRYTRLSFMNRDSLTSEETASLLEESTQGVYQAGTIVTGPLGIIDSQCTRYYPPKQTIGLWHCPLLDCRRLHKVSLEPPMIPLVEAYRLLGTASTQLWKTESRWRSPLICWPHTLSDQWRILSEMPLFLGDCIVGEDRTRLMTEVFKTSHSQDIRNILQSKSTNKADGDPETIASSLSTDEQLQLLLTLSDSDIKQLLDDLVWRGVIEIPTGEVREVDTSKRRLCSLPSSSALQLSSLGIRTTRQNSLLLLRHLIWDAYNQYSEMSDLDWRIQTPSEKTTQDALMEFLRTAKPPVAIEKLVLSSPRVTKSVAEALDTSVDNPGENTRVILEWKMGFNSPREDRRLTTLQGVIDSFESTLEQIGVPESELDRQAIRSSGVNAFVELEGFLDELISYLVWILSSDHAKYTRFAYTRRIAAKRVPVVLGKELASGSESLRWMDSGNTLGTYLRYLQETATWVEALPRADRTTLIRTNDETHDPPSDTVRIFPFRHIELWADANPTKLGQLATLINKCSAILNKANVPFIRNGLEHYREPNRFPPIDRIISVASAIREFTKFAIDHRLFPKLYWIHGTRTDPFGIRTLDLVDHNGAIFAIHLPQTIVGTLVTHGLSRAKPVLIAPGNILGMPNADIIFEVQQESTYSTYWHEYPAHGEEIILPSEDESLAISTPESSLES